MNRHIIPSPYLSREEQLDLETLTTNWPRIQAIIEGGGGIQEICSMLECRYSAAAKLLPAVMTLKKKFE